MWRLENQPKSIYFNEILNFLDHDEGHTGHEGEHNAVDGQKHEDGHAATHGDDHTHEDGHKTVDDHKHHGMKNGKHCNHHKHTEGGE